MTSTTPSDLASLIEALPGEDLSPEAAALERWAAQPKDAVVRAAGEKAIWSVLEKWALARCEADAGNTGAAVGQWSLGSAESRFVNAGWVDPRFNLDSIDAHALVDFVDRAFSDFGGPGQILTFSHAFAVEYRRRLGIEAAEASSDELAGIEARLEEKRQLVESRKVALERFLAEQPSADELRANQTKLNVMLPEIATVTRLSRQGGLTPQDRRVQLKINEASRRLSQANVMSMGTYEMRKLYEAQWKDLVEGMVEAQILEDEVKALSAQGEATGPTREECRQAALSTLVALRRSMGQLARTTESGAPPFVMEHAPRLAPRMVREKLDAVLRAAPKLGKVLDAGDLEILVLPGIGNPVFDEDAGRVLVALFPIEVKLHSILAAIGEALVRRNPKWVASYRTAKKLDSRSLEVWEHFRRDFVAWVESDSLGRRTLDTATGDWFSSELA